ncbi:MAG: hypothetical protein AB1671_24205 [Thermodesulfobacteriota bacterium]
MRINAIKNDTHGTSEHVPTWETYKVPNHIIILSETLRAIALIALAIFLHHPFSIALFGIAVAPCCFLGTAVHECFHFVVYRVHQISATLVLRPFHSQCKTLKNAQLSVCRASWVAPAVLPLPVALLAYGFKDVPWLSSVVIFTSLHLLVGCLADFFFLWKTRKLPPNTPIQDDGFSLRHPLLKTQHSSSQKNTPPT